VILWLAEIHSFCLKYAAIQEFAMAAAAEQRRMSEEIALGPLTHREIEQLGRLVNAFGAMGQQVIAATSADMCQRAYELLRKVRRQDEPFLKRLDKLARLTNDESPLQLMSDIKSTPGDVVEGLKLARRCLGACLFFGHCTVLYSRTEATLAAPDVAKSWH
jgi:hypothetical protein